MSGSGAEVVPGETTTYVFNATDLTTAADKESIAEGTSFAEGYFKTFGTVTKRSDATKVTSTEVGKNGTSGYQFTVAGSADVEIVFSSTGGSNTSAVGLLDSEGKLVQNKEAVAEVTGTSKVKVTYALSSGTYKVVSPESSYNRGARVYSIKVAETNTAVTNSYLFNATDLTTAADKEPIAEGTSFAEGYFKTFGTVTKRGDATKVTSTEVVKNGESGYQFTVAGSADVEIVFSSTGGSNTSAVGLLDSEGKLVQNKEAVTEVAGTSKVKVTYTLSSGTYKVVSPESSYNRGARVYSIKVVETSSGTRPDRKAWADVKVPVLGSPIVSGGTIEIEVVMEIGYDGADSVEVDMLAADGKVADTDVHASDGSSYKAAFKPTASGTYSFTARAIRENETAKTGNVVSAEFVLPLAAPALTVSCKGKGTAVVAWDAVPEADEYEVFVKTAEEADSAYLSKGKTTSVSMEVTGLTDGEKYTFKVTASRTSTNDTTEAVVEKYMTGLVEREFKSAPVGSGAKGTAAGDFYEKDGKVTISATGGKVADSEDGFVFYYTELGAKDNFTIDATFKISAVNVGGTMSNQTSFGLIAIDTIAGAGSSSGRYFNSAGAMTAKYRKMNPETGSASTFDNLAGLRCVEGYTNPAANEGQSTRKLSNTDTAFEYPDSNTATHSYEVGEVYHFRLRRSNTGYHGYLVKADGTVIEKIFYYPEGDDYTDPLFVQDAEHIYVGLMASRYIEVEVTDMSLTTIKPEEDDDRIQPPITYTIPNISIYSTTTIGTAEYPFEYRANIGGRLVVTDNKGKELINKEIKADEYVEETFTLTKGNNTFTCTLTPDQAEKLESYAPIVKNLTVSYQSYGSANQTIIVSPDGSASGTGSEKKPLDIYTAFKYAQPGQTILLKDGTYKLTEGLNVKRGHDGTDAGRITVVAQTPGKVILDLSNSSGGIVISADYWHLYGLDICNAPFGVKVVHIQGNHNIVELCKMYDNGDSGLQISGSSQEPNTKWPCYNLIKNCDAYDNADYKANDADGFAAKLTSGVGNIFEGCISHHNIDDGWDLYAKSTTGSIGDVVIRNCVTYANGFLSENARLKGQLLGEDQGEGNGFKLGGESMPGRHLLINSISFGNGAKGVTSNSGPDCRVQNVTAYGNAVFGSVESFSLYTNTASYTNYEAAGIISMAPASGKEDKRDVKNQASLDSETNYFFDGEKSVNISGKEASDDWFVSVDTTIVPTRNADGSINMHGLLELTSAAPSDAGGRLEAVISEYPNVPAAITDKVSSGNHSSGGSSSSSSSGSSSSSNTSASTAAPSSNSSADLGDTTGEWKKDEKGWWYQKADNTYPAESWLKVNGEWYLFGTDGYMKTGWQQTEDGKWYFLDSNDGDMKTGWLQTDGKWYFLDTENGDMKTGWLQTEDGKWYFLDTVSGDMKTGWLQTPDGKWYYLYEDGSCAMDTVTPDGYRVDENGAWVQ